MEKYAVRYCRMKRLQPTRRHFLSSVEPQIVNLCVFGRGLNRRSAGAAVGRLVLIFCQRPFVFTCAALFVAGIMQKKTKTQVDFH